MRTAIALAGLLALATSPVTAACYGGPASQACGEAYRDGAAADGAAGVTTLRGYDAEHGVARAEASSDRTRRKVSARGSAPITHATPRRRSFFYVCAPYRGCT